MKNLRFSRLCAKSVVRIVVASVIPVALLAGVSGADATTTPTVNPITLTAPTNLPGVAALPYTGTTAPTFSIPATVSALTVTPDQGVSGVPVVIAGSGLPSNASLTLTWSTNSATWVADVEPNTVNYLGTSYAKFSVVMATVTTNASGAFSFSTTAPSDFGGVHDIYAVENGVALAHGGFELLRILSVSPTSGPVGTPITISYTSMGASLYTGGASVIYDNHYAGEMMANWTRGNASITIPATGPVGPHYIQIGNAISYMYLNVIQSPIPYTNGGTALFTVTKDSALVAPKINWPASVAPTVSQFTTVSTTGLDPASSAVATLSQTSGPVNTPITLKVTGLPSSGTDQLVWSTVVGNRVNCASTCWAFTSNPLGSGTVTNGTLNANLTVPNGLGGWHVVQVLNASGLIEAQVPFYIKESIVPFTNKAGTVVSLGVATADDTDSAAALAAGQSGTGTYTFHENQEFTISIDGVGWTQLDNTLGVDYDNSYMGYGCGFNSNGYMVIHLHATGGPGIHMINLYPMLYSLSPSFASTPYGMVPLLSYAHDYPGLALGYQVPSIQFSIRVVK